MVDLVNDLDKLAEDRRAVLKNVLNKVQSTDKRKLKLSVSTYGNVQAKKLFEPILQQS